MKKTTKNKQVVNGCTPYLFTTRQEGQSLSGITGTKTTMKQNYSPLKYI